MQPTTPTVPTPPTCQPLLGQIYGVDPCCGFNAAGLNLRADHSRCVLPPIYPQQLAHQLGLGSNGLMDALGLSIKKFSLE
jgi:hypothetical protein